MGIGNGKAAMSKIMEEMRVGLGWPFAAKLLLIGRGDWHSSKEDGGHWPGNAGKTNELK